MTKFFYNGPKKSNEPDMFSGCLLLVGFGAIIFLLTQLEDLGDVKEYGWQIVLALIMGGSLFAMMFAKKAKLSNRHLVIENGYLKVEKISISMETLILDVYRRNDEFARYHLRDTAGKIAIYSVLKDDLLTHFEEELPSQVRHLEEHSKKHDGPFISVIAEGQSLYYNLDSGKYTLTQEGQPEISLVPEVFNYDGRYKKGVPLKKQLKNG